MMPQAHTSLWLCPEKGLCNEEARRGVDLSGPGRRAAFSGLHIGSITDADEAQAQTITTSSAEKVVTWQPWRLCRALMQVRLCPLLDGVGIFTDFSFAPKGR